MEWVNNCQEWKRLNYTFFSRGLITVVFNSAGKMPEFRELLTSLGSNSDMVGILFLWFGINYLSV